MSQDNPNKHTNRAMKDLLASASLAVLFQPNVWHQGVYYTVLLQALGRENSSEKLSRKK